MTADTVYDAKRASQHIQRLAVPRRVGTPGERAAQDYIAAQLAACGLTVERDPFEFTKFPAEVLPRLLCGAFVPIALAVPWFGSRFPLPVCLACLLSLGLAFLFTQWRRGFERLYVVGKPHRSVNIIGRNGVSRKPEMPALLLVAHYDSKSQVLPIAVRAVAYGVALFGLLLLAIGMLLQLSTSVQFPGGLLWGIAGATVLCLLLLQFNITENRSPGGFDNASGVGVLLEVARVAMARRENRPLIFLATGAEEDGMCGALRYIQRHPGPAAVINLDGLGVGEGVSIITRYGVPPVRTADRLRSLFRDAGDALQIPVTERYLPIGVGLDSIPLASRGAEAVTVTAGAVGGVALKVHSKADTPALLDVRSLQQVGELIVDVIERT